MFLPSEMLRTKSCFAKPPFVESCSCQGLGSPAPARGGWVPPFHAYLRDRLRFSCVSSLSVGALQHCHDFQMTSKEGSGGNGTNYQSFSNSPPARTGSGQPGLLLQKVMSLPGKEGFHGAFPLHAQPLLALLEELALLRPECNHRRLQPESCPRPRALHSFSAHTALQAPSSEQDSCPQKAAPRTTSKQPNINGGCRPISSQFLPALKHLSLC